MTEVANRNPNGIAPYYETYISLVKEPDLSDAFANQQEIVNYFFDAIDEEKAGYTYAPGKWTLKELLQHIIDAERIFSYRALAFARKETISLPGFDENEYAANSNAYKEAGKAFVMNSRL